MDKNQLSESLKELQDALQDATTLSESERQRLERLEANIQKKLDEEEDETLVDDLVDEIRDFEVAHPQITLALGHLMDILSQSGV